MENKKPASKDVIIEGETFALYDVTVNDRQVYVASSQLNKKIDECILKDLYDEKICIMDGEKCSVKDVDNSFQYIYGELENKKTPSEKEVIESVVEDMKNEAQAKFDREFETAVLNGNKQYLFMDKQTNQIHSLIEIIPGSNKYISANLKERISDEKLGRMVNINDRISDVVFIEKPHPSLRCKIDGKQQMALKLDMTASYSLGRMNELKYPKGYIQEYLRLKAAEMHSTLLVGLDESRSQRMKR